MKGRYLLNVVFLSATKTKSRVMSITNLNTICFKNIYVLHTLTLYEVNFFVIKSNCLRCSLWVYRYTKLDPRKELK